MEEGLTVGMSQLATLPYTTVFFLCFWLSESQQFMCSDIFYPWNRAVAPLSGRKPTLFLLTGLFVMKPKTGFEGPNLA